MGRDQSVERTVVVIGEGPLATTTAAMIASAAIRREGYSLLSTPGAGPRVPGRHPVAVAHQLARGTRALVVAVAAQPLHWSQVIERADQVVIASTTADVESAAAKLQALHGWGGRAAALAAGAVVVLSRADARHPAPSAVIGRFSGLARTTLAVPHEPQATVDPLQQSALGPASRSAWDVVIQVVSEDELPEDEMDTQPRIDVRDLFSGAAVPAGQTPPTAGSSWGGRLSLTGRTPWVVAAVAVALVLALGLTALVVRGGSPFGGGDTTAAPGLSPVEPVDGWSDQPEWVSEELAGGESGETVLVSGGTVIVTTGDAANPSLTALRTSDGSELWSTPIGGAVTGPPQLITMDDKPTVVAATANELHVWRGLGVEGLAPTVRSWSFTEADLRLVPGSPVPLLANEETLTALVLHDDALRKRSLPSGGTPMAADAQGRVLSVGSTAHWWLSTDGGDVSDGALLAPPDYGSLPGRVLGVSGTTLVVNWTRSKGATNLAGYDVMDEMEPTWATAVPGRVDLDDFDPSPDGAWAVAGTVTIDLRTGARKRLGKDWVTLRTINDRAWSTTSSTTKDGRTTTLDEPVSDPGGIPLAVTGNGLGLIVAAEGDGAARIYALRPDPDA